LAGVAEGCNNEAATAAATEKATETSAAKSVRTQNKTKAL